MLRLHSSLFCALLLLGAHTLTADILYSVTDLGTLGGANAYAYGLNSQGQVTGRAQTASGDFHAFAYTDGRMQDLGTLPGYTDGSSGTAINDLGQVTGSASRITVAGSVGHAFLYSTGVMQDLGALLPDQSVGSSINNLGQVAGTAFSRGSLYSFPGAFLYTDGQIQNIGSLPGYGNSVGIGINNLGQVTGTLVTYPSTPAHAFLYTDGVLQDLGALPGGLGNSYGYAVNDRGQVTGQANTPDGGFHAFLYSNGAMQDLGTLGSAYSIGWDLNNLGQVVGEGNPSPGASNHAFFYSDGRMQDLNNLIDPALGLTFGSARGINNRGQIIANTSTLYGEQGRAYLLTPLTPVPEPSTWALLGVSGLVLWAGARRFLHSSCKH